MTARVLFVDDDVMTLDLMGRVTQMLGHEPILKCTAQAAIDSARIDHPNLILVDLNLQEMDGLNLVRLLRASPDTASIPALIVSAGILPKADTLVGAEAFLEKPLGLETLSRLIEKYGNSKHAHGDQV